MFLRLLLTSNFPMDTNEAIEQEIRSVDNNPRILYVGYSASAEKYSKKLESYSFKNVDFINIAKTSIHTILFDMVFGVNFIRPPNRSFDESVSYI